MPIRLSNLRLPIEIPETDLPEHLARRLGLKAEELKRWRILKKSLDARSSFDLQFVYTTLVELTDASAESAFVTVRGRNDIQIYEPPRFEDATPGSATMAERPIIIG